MCRVSGIMNKSSSDAVPPASISEANNTNGKPPATSVESTTMIGDELAVSCSSSSFGPEEETQSEIKWIIVNNCVYTVIACTPIVNKPPISVGWVTDADQQLQQPVPSRTQRGGPIKIPVGPQAKNSENTVCTPIPSAQRKRPNNVLSSSPVFKRPRTHPSAGRDCAVDSAARAVTYAASVEYGVGVLLNGEMREKEMTVMIMNESDESRTISSYGVQPDRSKTMPFNASNSINGSGDVPKGILTAHILNCDLATFIGTTIDEMDDRSGKEVDRSSISSRTKLQKTTDRVPAQPREQPFSKEKTLGLTRVHSNMSQVEREHFTVVAVSNKNSPPADVGSSPWLVISLSLADINSLTADSTTPSADPSSPLTDTSSLSPVISSTPSDTNTSSTILRLPSTDPTSPHIIVITLPSDLEKLWSYLYSPLYDINSSPTNTSSQSSDFSSLRDDKLPSGVDINTPSVNVNSASADVNLRPASTAVGAQSVAEWFSQWTDVDDDQPEERTIDKDDIVGCVSVDVGVPAAACTLSGEPKRLAKVRQEGYPEEHVDGKRTCSPVTVVFVNSIGVEQVEKLSAYDCGEPANNKVPNKDEDDNRYSVEWVGLDDVRRFFEKSADAAERPETPKQPMEVERNDSTKKKEHISGQECVSRNIQISGTDRIASKDCISNTSHVVTEEQQRIVYNNCVVANECSVFNSRVFVANTPNNDCVVSDERISGNSHVSVDKRISGHVYATSAKYISGTGGVFSDMRISDNGSVADKKGIPFGRIFVVDKRIPNIDKIAVSNERNTGKSSVSENERVSIKKCMFYNGRVVNQDRICYNGRIFVVDKRISNRSHIANDKCISHNNIVDNEKRISYNGRVFVVNKLNNDSVAANNQHISGKGPDALNEERIPDLNHVISVEHNSNDSRVFDDDCLFSNELNLNCESTSDAWIEFMEVCQPSHDVFK